MNKENILNNPRKKILNGVLWTGLELGINQFISFAIRMVLAKMLFPSDFGIIGMANVFIGFIQVLNDIGIDAALIQRKDENLKEVHFHTAFWTGIIWSIVMYLIMSLIVGPLAARFYNEPILIKLTPVLSLGILAASVNLVHRAQLTKQMNFRRMAVIDNITNIAAGVVSIILAYLGAGVWALAFNSVASVVILMPLYFKSTGWKPKFIWNKQAFKDVFGFGLYTTGTSTVNYMMQNMDYLLIGKFFHSALLGVYTLAFLLTDTFRGRLVGVVTKVMYPLLSKMQNDRESLFNYYIKITFYNCFIAFPVMTIFFVLGRPFVLNFFGNNWEGTIAPLQILSISVLFHVMISGNSVLTNSLGKPNIVFRLQVIKSVIYLPMLFLGIYYYSIAGAAWVVLINKALAVILEQYVLIKIVKIMKSYQNWVIAILLPLIASTIAGLSAYSLYQSGVHYIIAGIVFLFVYFLAMILISKDILEETRKIMIKTKLLIKVKV
jgi:O-antigen/teichoic acid export membrane protein